MNREGSIVGPTYCRDGPSMQLPEPLWLVFLREALRCCLQMDEVGPTPPDIPPWRACLCPDPFQCVDWIQMGYIDADSSRLLEGRCHLYAVASMRRAVEVQAIIARGHDRHGRCGQAKQCADDEFQHTLSLCLERTAEHRRDRRRRARYATSTRAGCMGNRRVPMSGRHAAISRDFWVAPSILPMSWRRCSRSTMLIVSKGRLTKADTRDVNSR